MDALLPTWLRDALSDFAATLRGRLGVPDDTQAAETQRRVELPIWPGKVIGRLTREELYDDAR